MAQLETISNYEKEVRKIERLINTTPVEYLKIDKLKATIHVLQKKITIKKNEIKEKKIKTNSIESVLQKKYRYFLESINNNGIIYGPTQIDKTEAIREYIEVCIVKNVPVILSCDHKTDELIRIYNDVKSNMSGRECSMIITSDTRCAMKVENCIVNSKMFILFCFYHESHIQIARSSIRAFNDYKPNIINTISIIHNETTENDTKNKWDDLKETIDNLIYKIDLKSIFVTETPEYCMTYYNIESAYVIELGDVPGYTGWNDIEYINIDGYNIKDILMNEVNEKSEGGGVILYVKENCQTEIVSEFGYLNCLTHTYTNEGITTMYTAQIERGVNEYIILNKKTKVTINSVYLNIQGMPIGDFYKICKDLGHNVILTIGMDLINCGISYVSTGGGCICATTMIYNPEKLTNNIVNNRIIGRITGIVNPHLDRKLYSTKDIINNYVNLNRKTEHTMNSVRSSEYTTRNISHSIMLNKDLLYKSKSKLLKLINIWMADNTVFAKIFRFIWFNSNGVNEYILKQYIESISTGNGNYYYIEINKNEYSNIIYTDENRVTSLTVNALEYIKTMK
jgi:hypothetical protein